MSERETRQRQGVELSLLFTISTCHGNPSCLFYHQQGHRLGVVGFVQIQSVPALGFSLSASRGRRWVGKCRLVEKY